VDRGWENTYKIMHRIHVGFPHPPCRRQCARATTLPHALEAKNPCPPLVPPKFPTEWQKHDARSFTNLRHTPGSAHLKFIAGIAVHDLVTPTAADTAVYAIASDVTEHAAAHAPWEVPSETFSRARVNVRLPAD
jgi:hypothetical protein